MKFTKFLSVLASLIAGMCLMASAVSFSDVEGHWAYEQIMEYAEKGIVNGDPEGTFRPDDTVTREEFCKIMLNAFGVMVTASETESFSDVPADAWSYAFVEGAKMYLPGYDDGTYLPGNEATRADVTAAIVKIMGYPVGIVTDSELALTKFSDGADIDEDLVIFVSLAVEKGLVNGALPLKVCYIGGCYRYEKPQAGRLREFHQFGVECVGAAAPNADAEVIALARQVLDSIGIEKISLEINSIGCPECRKKYSQALKDYFKANIDTLCDTCKDRLDRNPMRILDCKSPVCKELAANAPVVIDYLCDECEQHFTMVKKHLDTAGIEYTVNPHIVRGLDYYTRTVFEFVSGDIGAQSTVCGGGRYDGLISQMGGQPTASLGFAMGIERLMMVLESQKTELPKQSGCDLYIAQMGENASLAATALCNDLRADGFKVQTDICGRGLKAQMKFADKIGASFTMVLGDDELQNKKAKLKNMSTGEQTEVSLESLSEDLFKALNACALDSLADSIFEGAN